MSKKIQIKVNPNLKQIPIDHLVPYAKNPRKITKAVPLVAESIKSFGFNVPITINNMIDKIIVSGHTRYEAAKKLGMENVPYIELNHLSDMDIRKYRLADNRVSDESEWDKNLLRNELAELELNSKLDAEWFKNIGFSQEEIAQALAGTMKEQEEAKQKTLECPKCGHAW
jgi:site-specific DNA-methyltransferase (adenine-specific)